MAYTPVDTKYSPGDYLQPGYNAPQIMYLMRLAEQKRLQDEQAKLERIQSYKSGAGALAKGYSIYKSIGDMAANKALSVTNDQGIPLIVEKDKGFFKSLLPKTSSDFSVNTNALGSDPATRAVNYGKASEALQKTNKLGAMNTKALGALKIAGAIGGAASDINKFKQHKGNAGEQAIDALGVASSIGMFIPGIGQAAAMFRALKSLRDLF